MVLNKKFVKLADIINFNNAFLRNRVLNYALALERLIGFIAFSIKVGLLIGTLFDYNAAI